MTLRDPALYAPLAEFHGKSPPAPRWFDWSISLEPERRMVDVDGVAIEALAWGSAANPGLLLVHGNGANAEWWRFVAPFFADEYRVVALSLSGTGNSSWRTRYGAAQFRSEALQIAEAFELFANDKKPFVVGHSMGGAVSILLTARYGERFRGAVILDSHIAGPNHRWGLGRVPEPPRVSWDIPSMLARFRFAPPQPCHALYIADFIARSSIRQVTVDGRSGWTWKHDPALVGHFDFEDVWLALSGVRCPLAIIRGELSNLTSPSQLQAMKDNSPTGTITMTMPEAHHHVMVDQPLALVTALRALFAAW